MDTVRAYLAIAAAFVMDTLHKTPDPRFAREGRRVEYLEAILVYAKSLKDELNRREPVPTTSPAFLRWSGKDDDKREDDDEPGGQVT